jgi:inorganic pyrophosphatase
VWECYPDCYYGVDCFGVIGYDDDDDGDMMTLMMRTSGDGGVEMNEINDADDVVAFWLTNHALSNHYCSYHYMKNVRVVSVGGEEGF